MEAFTFLITGMPLNSFAVDRGDLTWAKAHSGLQRCFVARILLKRGTNHVEDDSCYPVSRSFTMCHPLTF